MVHKIRLMMFSLNMVDYPVSVIFISMYVHTFFLVAFFLSRNKLFP